MKNKLELISTRKETRIGKTGKINNYTIAKVKCLNCSREYEKIFYKTALETTCLYCEYRRKSNNSYGTGYKAVGEISGGQYGRIKKCAKHRNLEFLVTKEFLWELFLKQDRKCALSGLPLNFKSEYKNSSTGICRFLDTTKITASLDRIDSSKGYTEDNVQWVHKILNTMKSTLSNDVFLSVCNNVVRFNNKDNTEPSFIDGFDEISTIKKVQRLTSELP